MKILVVKLSSLGDHMHALPAVHCLKTGLGACVHWVTQPEYVGLVHTFSDVDKVMAFPRKQFCLNVFSFIKDLRGERYDMVVDFQGLFKSALVCGMARTSRRIGPSFYREGASIFYREVAGSPDRDRHAVEQNMDVVRHLGMQTSEIKFPLDLTPTDLPGKPPLIALCPSSRWRSKNWPQENFIELGKRLLEDVGGTVFLLGGKDEAKQCKEMAGSIGNATSLAGKTSLAELPSVLSAMDLLISNDSGPMHVAAAAGTPVLSVFGPTDPGRTGPYGELHRVIRTALPCQPCFDRDCKLSKECISSITVDMMAEAAVEMLRARDG